MKRHDLIRELGKIGCVLIRHGAKHDWYQNPNTRISQPSSAPQGNQRLVGKAHSQDAQRLNLG